jgi:4-amino-4-deoxy-L-arabinose transferase-like glycosyltransferase
MPDQHTFGSVSRITRQDCWSVATSLALLATTLLYLRTELTFDEAIYLRFARTITQTGLPLWRDNNNFSIQTVFQDSPPLVLYTAAVTQAMFPGNDVPARLLSIAIFVLPTYGITWWITRTRFGPVPAVAVLLAFLTSGIFMRETSHVLLQIPLGLFACMTLVSFDSAVSSLRRRRTWAVLTGLSLGLAVWTKYQAICIAMSIGLYLLYMIMRRRAEIRSQRLPLIAAVIGALTALAALIVFYWAVGEPETLRATLSLNRNRWTPASMSAGQLARAMIDTGRECVTTIGPALLVLSVIGICFEYRHRRLVLLLASYVVTTIGFNFVVFRLPGAGTAYLIPAMPAFAVLGGLGASYLVTAAATLPRLVFAGSMRSCSSSGRPVAVRIGPQHGRDSEHADECPR